MLPRGHGSTSLLLDPGAAGWGPPHVWMRPLLSQETPRGQSHAAAPPGKRGCTQLCDRLQAPSAASGVLRGEVSSGHPVPSHTLASLPGAPSSEGWRLCLAGLHVGSSPPVVPGSPASRRGGCQGSCPGWTSSAGGLPGVRTYAPSTGTCRKAGGRWDWGPHMGTRRPAHFHLGLVLQAGLVPLLLHQGAGQRR